MKRMGSSYILKSLNALEVRKLDNLKKRDHFMYSVGALIKVDNFISFSLRSQGFVILKMVFSYAGPTLAAFLSHIYPQHHDFSTGLYGKTPKRLICRMRRY